MPAPSLCKRIPGEQWGLLGEGGLTGEGGVCSWRGWGGKEGKASVVGEVGRGRGLVVAALPVAPLSPLI